jgi:hypothetical protein
MRSLPRYRKVYPRLWASPAFRDLKESARLLALYLLTGPQTNRLGVFKLSVATTAEDLGISVETVKRGLADLREAFGWHFDADARVLYIPSWWRWNPPENPNVLTGNLKDLSDIPPSTLVEAFATNLETSDRTLHQTFNEGVRQRLRGHSPNQKQYQYQDLKQEQEPRASRGNEEESISISATVRPPNDKLLSIARETLQLTSPDDPFDTLVDAFSCVARQKGLRDWPKSDATQALSYVLSERRRATA